MNNEEAISISKASYMAGVLDERNEWYKKINEKIEELDKQEKAELKGVKGQDRYFIKQMYQVKRQILKELIGKEE